MLCSTLLRGASARALTLVLVSTSTLAQESLPTIDIGAERAARIGAGTLRGGTPAALETGSSADKETGYVRSSSFGATKTNAPLIDTPIAVQIIPREVIRDKQILSVIEAVQNVSGVQAQPGTLYDQYQIRGFSSGYGATYRNGLKLEGIFGGEDVLFTDRVEVVKGPSSVLYGRIEPGGFVNVTTKRPQEGFHAELKQQVGNWGLIRSTADVTGALTADKSILYRAMAVFDHADSFMNFDHRNNAAAALFLTFRPTNDFEFNVQIEHYEKKQTAPSGFGQIPVVTATIPYGRTVLPLAIAKPMALPRNFSSNDPSMWTDFPFTAHRTLYAYDWSYRFAQNWKLTNRFHYMANDENFTYLVGQSYNPTTGNILRRFASNPWQRDILSTNLDLNGQVATGPIKHDVLVGVDWYSAVEPSSGFIGTSPLFSNLNVFAPNYGSIGPALRYFQNFASNNTLFIQKRRDFGVYAQDQISLLDDRLHILLAGRWDKAESVNSMTYGDNTAACFPLCPENPSITYSDKPKFSPRAGVLFKVTPDTAVYGSYVRSFGQRSAVIGVDGRLQPPEEGVQWEAGVKSQWFDGSLTGSVTLFDLTKTNIVQPDPLRPGTRIAVGTVNSRGIEVDLAGQVTDNLSVIASYTFDVAKITSDNNNGNAGHRFYGVAPHVGNIWAKWDTAPNQPEGWEFGGGVYVMDYRWGNNQNTWIVPAYVKFDAMAGYRMPIGGYQALLQLNVKNLTDTTYFEAGNGPGNFALYGAPRTFIGSVSLKF